LLTAVPQDPYASNWLERLRHIKRLKSKVQEQQKQEEDGSSQLSDFTGHPVSKSYTALHYPTLPYT
jgi:hypothetical protein